MAVEAAALFTGCLSWFVRYAKPKPRHANHPALLQTRIVLGINIQLMCTVQTYWAAVSPFHIRLIEEILEIPSCCS
jgi:hypothetical protein